jgi:hypothetical protein
MAEQPDSALSEAALLASFPSAELLQDRSSLALSFDCPLLRSVPIKLLQSRGKPFLPLSPAPLGWRELRARAAQSSAAWKPYTRLNVRVCSESAGSNGPTVLEYFARTVPEGGGFWSKALALPEGCSSGRSSSGSSSSSSSSSSERSSGSPKAQAAASAAAGSAEPCPSSEILLAFEHDGIVRRITLRPGCRDVALLTDPRMMRSELLLRQAQELPEAGLCGQRILVEQEELQLLGPGGQWDSSAAAEEGTEADSEAQQGRCALLKRWRVAEVLAFNAKHGLHLLRVAGPPGAEPALLATPLVAKRFYLLAVPGSPQEEQLEEAALPPLLPSGAGSPPAPRLCSSAEQPLLGRVLRLHDARRGVLLWGVMRELRRCSPPEQRALAEASAESSAAAEASAESSSEEAAAGQAMDSDCSAAQCRLHGCQCSSSAASVGLLCPLSSARASDLATVALLHGGVTRRELRELDFVLEPDSDSHSAARCGMPPDGEAQEGEEAAAAAGPRGLVNMGETCYLNAVLQVLARSRPLLRGLQAAQPLLERLFCSQKQQQDAAEGSSSSNSSASGSSSSSSSHRLNGRVGLAMCSMLSALAQGTEGLRRGADSADCDPLVPIFLKTLLTEVSSQLVGGPGEHDAHEALT